ncbi:hypothetical protein [Streptacidiphilus cavernicola]|uniref:Uncharacterized protein n=1 Tax=Streptacidiphilus cavernicola TaxID=3342716 RepID=A0ABV6W258_9ACTN
MITTGAFAVGILASLAATVRGAFILRSHGREAIMGIARTSRWAAGMLMIGLCALLAVEGGVIDADGHSIHQAAWLCIRFSVIGSAVALQSMAVIWSWEEPKRHANIRLAIAGTAMAGMLALLLTHPEHLYVIHNARHPEVALYLLLYAAVVVFAARDIAWAEVDAARWQKRRGAGSRRWLTGHMLGAAGGVVLAVYGGVVAVYATAMWAGANWYTDTIREGANLELLTFVVLTIAGMIFKSLGAAARNRTAAPAA